MGNMNLTMLKTRLSLKTMLDLYLAQTLNQKKISKFFPGQGQDQVQANAGFQAQPCFQRVQVHVLRGYTAFWPENHFTWQI